MVHASSGHLDPVSDLLLSEPAIVAGMAKATLATQPVNWNALIADYDAIRNLIEAVIPGFEHFNHQLQQPGGFYLGNSARDRQWHTAGRKARFFAHKLPDSIIPAALEQQVSSPLFVLQTLRSHDQFNTTVYGLDDRYRGIYGQRKVLFICTADIVRLGMKAGDRVDLESVWTDGISRRVEGFTLVEYETPAGNLAAYFPETNPLVPLDSFGEQSFTPTSKAIAVTLCRSSGDTGVITKS